MPPDIDLSKLSHAEKDDLILRLLPLIGRLEAAHARIAELEKRFARLEQPPKNSSNSSKPPSTGEKPNLPSRDKKPRRGRPGVTRALAQHPDRIIEATLAACPHCDHALGAEDISDIHAYDHIDPPVIRPVVTRVNRHRGVCPCCRKAVAAPAPEAWNPARRSDPGSRRSSCICTSPRACPCEGGGG